MDGYIVFIILFLVIFITEYNTKKAIRHIIKVKYGGNKEMEEIIKSYIDKDVEITLLEHGVEIGTIIKYNDGWVIIKDVKDNEKALNCNYIIKVELSKYLEKLKQKQLQKAEKDKKI